MATHDMLCDHKVHRKGYSVENSKMKLVAVAEKWRERGKSVHHQRFEWRKCCAKCGKVL